LNKLKKQNEKTLFVTNYKVLINSSIQYIENQFTPPHLLGLTFQKTFSLLVPTNGKLNGYRDNYAFGETSTPTTTTGNGCKVGSCSYTGYTRTIFEPVDEYKGDFARNYFYMATRYADIIANWETNQPRH